MKANILGAAMRAIPQIPAYERMKNTDGSPLPAPQACCFCFGTARLERTAIQHDIFQNIICKRHFIFQLKEVSF